MSEKALVVGGGGRENALAWKLAQSPLVDGVLVAPGNAGTEEIGENLPVSITDVEAIVQTAKANKADLVLVSQEDALAAGAVDALAQENITAFGPTQAAARLESSKRYANDFMNRHGIPCARIYYATNQMAHAQAYINMYDTSSYVLKADCLMEGKGVGVPDSREDARQFLSGLAKNELFLASNRLLLIYERLSGKELSVFALSDGERGVMLPFCRDYKRLFDGDKKPNPNTGGMGSYGPVEIDSETATLINDQIIQPTIRGMAAEGQPFKGVLYAGLMLTEEGPKVLEFNVRFGDPECQALMLLLGEDLYPLLQAAALGRLEQEEVKMVPGSAITVAVSAPNYGFGKPQIGSEIYGLDRVPEGIHAFHGGTKRVDGKVLTNGGRVLHLASLAETLALAKHRVLGAIGTHAIHFAGMHYRKTIGE